MELKDKENIEQLRESLRIGLAKTKAELYIASQNCLENPSRQKSTKATSLRKKYTRIQEALEMNDEELEEEFLIGNFLTKK